MAVVLASAALTCSIEGCDRSHDSLGFCGMHAQRLRRHGDALWEPQPMIARRECRRLSDRRRSKVRAR